MNHTAALAVARPADKLHAKRETQFAALPWRRMADGSVKVLVISSRETRRWVIPKGWPMKGRTPAAAAAQEAFEEAGVVCAVDAEAIGAYRYRKRLRDGRFQGVQVSVFPLEVLVEQLCWPEQAERVKRWISPAEASLMVDEPDLKALLRDFHPRS